MNPFDLCPPDLHTETEQDGDPHGDDFRVHFLLDDLQSPINIGKCARIAEIYRMDLYIHDQRRLTADPDALQVLSDFSCGAWERGTGHVLRDLHRFLSNHKKGRVIATCLQKDAIRLQDFEFAPDDLIMFGNEYDGLKPELIERADAKIYIPMPGAYLPKPYSRRPIDPERSRRVNQNGVPNLNVAVAAGIVGYAFSCWLECNRHAETECQNAFG